MAVLHVTLGVRDVARAAEFYHQHFNWPRIDRPQNILCPAAWLQVGVNQELHLLQVEGFAPSEFEAEFGRHVAWSWPADDLGQLRTRLATAGVEIIEPARETPFRRFFFRDLDGYVMEVVGV